MIQPTNTIIELRNVTKIMHQNIDQGRKSAFLRLVLGKRSTQIHRSDEYFGLRNVTLKVAPQETIGIIGKEGPWLLTLGKVMAQLLKPDAGSAFSFGKCRIVHKRTGVPRPLMTTETYIKTLASFIGTCAPEIKALTELAFKQTNSEKYRKSKLKDLPPTNLKLIDQFILRSSPADVYLFFDPIGTRFKELQEQLISNKTALFLSSDPNQLPSQCNRFVVFHGGHIHYDGANLVEAKRILEEIPQTSEEIPIEVPPSQTKKEHPVLIASASSKISPSHAFADTLKDYSERKGSGAVRFCHFCLYNQDGEAVSEIGAGEPLEIQLKYVTLNAKALKKKVTQVTIAILDALNRRVLSLPSRCLTASFENSETEGVFVCQIPQLQLIPGKYKLFASIHINEHLADKLTHHIRLKVTATKVFANQYFPSSFFGSSWILFDWKHQQYEPGTLLGEEHRQLLAMAEKLTESPKTDRKSSGISHPQPIPEHT